MSRFGSRCLFVALVLVAGRAPANNSVPPPGVLVAHDGLGLQEEVEGELPTPEKEEAEDQDAPTEDPDGADAAGSSSESESSSSSGETIADPEDGDDWIPKVATPTVKVTDSGSSSPQTTYRVRGSLRLAMDLMLDGPVAADPWGYREDVMALLGQTFASLNHSVSSSMRLTLSGMLTYRLTAFRPDDPDAAYYFSNGDIHRNEFEADLADSFLSLGLSWIDLQLGLITVKWGCTDLVNPNDVLAAQDLRNGLFLDPETSRLPTLMLKADIYWRELTLSLYWMPVFTPNRIELFGSDYSLFGPASPQQLQGLGSLLEGMINDSVEGPIQSSLSQTRRPLPWKDSSFGVRLSQRWHGWEFGIQYAWIFERTPVLRMDPQLVLALLPLLPVQPGGLTDEQRKTLGEWLTHDPFPLESIYRRQHHAGLNLAGVLWKFALNLDLAYQSRQALTLGGALPMVDDNGWLSSSTDSQVVASTLGLTYTYGDEILVSFEGWHRLYLDILTQAEAERPQLLLGGPHQAGIAFLGRYYLASINLTFQLLAHSDLWNRSLIVTPQLSYRVGDHLGVFAGVNIFEGATNSVGGRLDQNDQAFVGLEGYL